MNRTDINTRSLTIHLPEPTYAALVERARGDGDGSLSSVVRSVLAQGLTDARVRPGGDAGRFEGR